MLSFQRMNIVVPDLAPVLENYASALGGEAWLEARDVEIVGPLPCYVLRPREVIADVFEFRFTGWEALARSVGARPLVVGLFETDEGWSASLIGDDAGLALEEAIARSMAFEESETVYEVRSISLPDIYLSGLWLGAGDNSVFLPTRIGDPVEALRPDMTPAQLRELVALLLELAGGPAVRFDGEVARDESGPGF